MAERTDRIDLEIVTPEKRVLSMRVDDVTLPSVDGYMGVLPGHAPLLARLDAGELSYLDGGSRSYLAVSGGFVEVLRGSVSVLARTSERADEIDVERAQRAKQRAESTLADAGRSEQAFRAAEVKLKRAISRIRVHGQLPG